MNYLKNKVSQKKILAYVTRRWSKRRQQVTSSGWWYHISHMHNLQKLKKVPDFQDLVHPQALLVHFIFLRLSILSISQQGLLKKCRVKGKSENPSFIFFCAILMSSLSNPWRYKSVWIFLNSSFYYYQVTKKLRSKFFFCWFFIHSSTHSMCSTRLSLRAFLIFLCVLLHISLNTSEVNCDKWFILPFCESKHKNVLNAFLSSLHLSH